MTERKFDRRQMLKGVLLGAASIPALLPELTQAAPVKLLETDPTAQALGYHASAKAVYAKAFPSYKPNQKCENCLQLQPGTGPDRGCNLFPGKLVSVDGWCKVWVQKV